MSIATSREERDQAAAQLAEKSDEQLRDDLAYWTVAAKDHTDTFNALTEKRVAVTELYQETQVWVALITEVLQKRRPTPAARGGLS